MMRILVKAFEVIPYPGNGTSPLPRFQVCGGRLINFFSQDIIQIDSFDFSVTEEMHIWVSLLNGAIVLNTDRVKDGYALIAVVSKNAVSQHLIGDLYYMLATGYDVSKYQVLQHSPNAIVANWETIYDCETGEPLV